MTQTSTVNLHGCKVRMHHQVLVGMMVTVESKATHTSAKGVCVHVFDSQPGTTGFEIAVQLLKPQNLWGIENPPSDWESVALELVKGRGALPLVREANTRDVPQLVVQPADPRFAESPQGRAPALLEPKPPEDFPDPEIQLAILEQRAAQLMESVLQILHTQTEEFVRDTLDTLRQQAAALAKEAEEQIKKRAERTYEDVEGSLFELRADLAEQLSERTEQIVANAEEALRSKVGELLATMLKPAPKK